jgi:hypothetical protein
MNICRPNVSAAMLRDVDTTLRTGDENPKRYRAKNVGARKE